MTKVGVSASVGVESRRPAFGISDPEPWSQPVNGADLLEEVARWIGAYVHCPSEVADAIALYAVTTWFPDEVEFACILAVLSPTKACGKTTLLDILKPLVRRGYRTSSVGCTTAVLFRLNERYSPTFLIDEAEKLAERHAAPELIAMLNVGYRHGATVARCVEQSGTDYDIREYGAYGFRVLASIGTLWDTIMDRAIIVWLDRKPRAVKVRRFATLVVEREGAELARKLRRWTDDHRSMIALAVPHADRPEWLSDRACDHWANLFAVAAVVGGSWPQRALSAARALSGIVEERDPAELLIQDVWRLWKSKHWGEAIQSGELSIQLNHLEGSPWGGYGNYQGITTHRLANMLKPLGLSPRQSRTTAGTPVRGYWWVDLERVIARYPPPEVVQAVQEVPDKGFARPDTPDVPVVPVVPHEAGDGTDLPLPPAPTSELVEEGRFLSLEVHPSSNGGCRADGEASDNRAASPLRSAQIGVDNGRRE